MEKNPKYIYNEVCWMCDKDIKQKDVIESNWVWVVIVFKLVRLQRW